MLGGRPVAPKTEGVGTLSEHTGRARIKITLLRQDAKRTEGGYLNSSKNRGKERSLVGHELHTIDTFNKKRPTVLGREDAVGTSLS